MAFYAVTYTVPFESAVACGIASLHSHVRFQSRVQESLLFDRIWRESPGSRAQFEGVLSLIRQGYTRNFAPVSLGERVAIFLTFDEPTPSSVRLCVRTLKEDGEPVAAGFQEIAFAHPSGGLALFPQAMAEFLSANLDLYDDTACQSFSEAVISAREPDALFTAELRLLAGQVCASEGGRVVGRSPPSAFPERLAAGTVLVFPGQGSFNVKLLAALAADRECPSAAGLVEAADGESRAALGHSFRDLVTAGKARQDELLRECPDLDQYGIFVTGLLIAEKARSRGFIPGAVAGHSFGEVAALCAAGVIEVADGLRAVSARVLALKACGAQGGMLAVPMARMAADAFLDDRARAAGCTVAVANHPGQTIISGPEDELNRISVTASAGGATAVRLASRMPYHSATLAPAARAMAYALRTMRAREPAIPILSPILGASYGAGSRPGADLASHLVTSVDWPAAVATLLSAGADAFVECGAGGALSKFVRQLAPNHVTTTTGETVAASGLGVAPRAPAAAAVRTPIEGAVAIVAMGAVVPGARDVASFWQNCLDGTGGIRDQRDLDPNYETDFGSETITVDKNYSCLFGVVEDAVLPRTFGDHTTRAERFLDEALRQCVEAEWRREGRERQFCLLGSTADGIAEYDDAVFGEGVLDAIDRLPPPEGLDRGAAVAVLRALPWWREGDPEDHAPHPLLRRVVERRLGDGVALTLIDAACASSLYAIDSGMRMLAAGLCDAAYVGGVFACGPATPALFSQFGGLSRAGSRPFDEAADGVVFGEGAAVLVIKRLEDAVADGDPIHGVIRSVGLSSDGRTPSVNVPRVAGQSLAVRNAYHGDLHRGTVQYIEAHATATAVGDATEFASLSESFVDADAPARIALGSVKSLVGHLGWLAGVASVIKVVKALEARAMPPQHRFEKANAKIDLDASPFVIPKVPVAWPPNRGGLPRRAAVSGFGFGGTNAHLVIEEYEPGFHAAAAGGSRREESDRIVAVALGAAFSDGSAAWAHEPGARVPAYAPTVLRAPKGKRLLPDIVEQMDAGQFMLLEAAGQAIDALGDIAALRERTGIVVGSSGKSRRAASANERVLADRLTRTMAEGLTASGLEEGAARSYAARLGEAIKERNRTSNAYTLVGMMPNVMTGRVANMYDLMGPNMVVDAGGSSLLASFRAADRMLRDGVCDMVLAGGMNATAPWPGGGCPPGDADRAQDGACVVALTTRDVAHERHLPVLGTVRIGASGDDSLLISRDGPPVRELCRIQVEPGRPHEVSGLDGLVQAFRNGDSLLTWTPVAPRVAPSSARELPRDVAFHVPVAVDIEPLLFERKAVAGIAAYVADTPTLAGLIGRALRQGEGPAVMAPLAAEATDAEARAAASALPLDACSVLIIATDLSGVSAGDLLEAERAERLAESAFAACRGAFDRIQNGSLAVIALALGGWRNGFIHPSAALLSGFLKSLACEAPDAIVRCVALEGADPAAAAMAVETELALAGSGQVDIDIVVAANRARRAIRLTPLDPVCVPGTKLRLDRSSVVLATGGGRGITAAMLATLMERHGCAAVVVGRQDPEALPTEVAAMSDAAFAAHETAFYSAALKGRPGVRMPQLRAEYSALAAGRELAATLRTLAGYGRVDYVRADMSDAAAVDAAVRQAARLHGGRIDLVLHGAGLQVSKRLPARNLSEWRRTLSTKLGGLRNLYAACARHADAASTEYHLVSSVAGAVGNDGQADYAAANAGLNALADALDGGSGGSRWTAIGWLGWRGAGMAGGSDYTALFDGRGSRMLAPDEGKALFSALFDAQPRRGGVVVLPRDGASLGFGRLVLSPPAGLEQVAAAAEWTLDHAAMPWLACHLVGGIPTLPGAFMADFVVQAVLSAGATGDHVQIGRLDFHRFLKVPFGASVRLRSSVEARDDGYHVKLMTDFIHVSGRILQKDIVHAEAFVRIGDRPFPTSLEGLRVGWIGHGGLADPYLGPRLGVSLSGPFKCLSDIEGLGLDRRARFEVATGEREAMPRSGAIPALLLDAMFRLMAVPVDGTEPGSFVPLSVHDLCARLGVDDRSIAALGAPLILEGRGLSRDGQAGVADGCRACATDGASVLSFARCEARDIGRAVA